MIRAMVGSRIQRRTAPSLLLIGLILLVGSHLLGALHGPGFIGPHQPLFTTASAVSAAAEPAALGADHDDHGHGHDVVEDTVEHAVDRVRDESDHPVRASQLTEPAAERPVMSASPDGAAPREGGPSPGGGRSACVRHCVWRQ
ncbi:MULTISPECIES: hypothetical protein [Streptomyces]|uniref:hypothetical protein n=1 Tax=Streptomyces TaxID=1883 RepID=UPI000B81370C|nr:MULTISPECIES: hypothetical protein [unclassified Streptomyces]